MSLYPPGGLSAHPNERPWHGSGNALSNITGAGKCMNIHPARFVLYAFFIVISLDLLFSGIKYSSKRLEKQTLSRYTSPYIRQKG